MAGRPWDDRPLPPLPSEAHFDSTPSISVSETRATVPSHGTTQNHTHTAVRAAGHDISYQPESSVQHSSYKNSSARLSPGRPPHSRSMSNPFPSFFSGKKKRDRTQIMTPPSPYEASEDGNLGRQHVPPRLSAAKPTAQGRRPNPAHGPNDFRTGHCMTCASLVRWPKSLGVFRCTICMTVNDIEAPSSGQSSDDKIHASGSSTSTKDGISTSYTKDLIQRCLVSSLRSFMSVDREQFRRADTNKPFVLPLRHSMAPPESAPSTKGPDPSLPHSASSHSSTSPGHVSAAGAKPIATRGFATPEGHHQFSSSFPGNGEIDSRRPSRTRDAVPDERIFKGVEDYLADCFKSHSCLNNSFRTLACSPRARPEQAPAPPAKTQHVRSQSLSAPDLPDIDPKLLMLGNIAENGFWWTGGQDARKGKPTTTGNGHRHTRSQMDRSGTATLITADSFGIDWKQVMEWYHTIVHTPSDWRVIYDDLVSSDSHEQMAKASQQQFETVLIAAQHRLHRVFLKCIETLLKRPGTLISAPENARFLLILACNPLLTASAGSAWEDHKSGQTEPSPVETRHSGSSAGRHSGITKRLFGLLANSSEDCHRHLILWFTSMPDHLFSQVKDLTSSFITHRLTRQSEKVVENKVNVIDSLVPQMSEHDGRSNTVSLHAALHGSNTGKRQKQPAEPKQSAYINDWQLKAAARVMAQIFAANNGVADLKRTAARNPADARPLPISDFYHSLVDTLDFTGDFELWESKRAKFTFCQYPFFLSLWAKIQIMEHDAKRQMTGKAREAFFDSILSHRTYAQYLTLKIRRDCLVDDSLKQVSGIVGSGSEDIKKALRIEFDGEEGVDAGGLRKEWFLLLIREVFNPDHGLFIYDSDSQLCYFNPHSFETSDQFFLVGVVLGLAIYNSTILDIALPPFAFRKLLAAGPPAGSAAHAKPKMTYTLDDLAELRPATARGLRQLLEYDGDVQTDLCLDFVVELEKYGSHVRVPLCAGGETKMVTASNRREYVDLYVRYHLDTAVTRQFEPFKRGFFTVCGGNALSLFRAEEIELLVRGSDEPLDIKLLQGAAEYSHWPKDSTPETEPTVQWFWQTFEKAKPSDQRRLLAFVTGSDRIPATGAAALTIRVNCLGEDEGRFPSARTCFNMLSLYRCKTRTRLEETLWRAVYESEGFGLK
ncbi:E3 ubiquitin-protein ligase HECTD2 [Microdochium nivale]|nr:E3 ubiquitin-protein ligase HECTD2 [Microdochium nivale]